jgi:zona occludens toxin
MINGLEGIPGSGKSYESVVYHVLESLKRGRKVVTNLPLNVDAFAALDPSYAALIDIRTGPRPVLGTWDAERTPAFKLFEPGEVDPNPRVHVMPDGTRFQARPPARIFGHVWDFYDEWKSSTGQGPVFIIDECHIGLPKEFCEMEVVEWYKLHRHFNCDVLLCTQNFRQINQDIAGLIAMLIKVRSADILGKKDCYIRKVHAGYRGAVISTEERPYKKQFFVLYRSHTQGNSVSESSAADVKPMMRNFNRIKWFFIAVTVLLVGWKAYGFVFKKDNPFSPTRQISGHVTPPGALLTSSSQPVVQAAAPVIEIDPEPLADHQVSITGWAKLGERFFATFTVSKDGKRVFDSNSVELAKAGYYFKSTGDCMGLLYFSHSKPRTVICDAPSLATGGQTDGHPTLLAVPTQARL